MPMHDRLLARTSVTLTSAAAFLLPALPAQAHVKWFAPYIVGAPPQPVTITLADPGFWTGIALVLAFFLRSEEHTSELQSLMRISYAVLCLKKKIKKTTTIII